MSFKIFHENTHYRNGDFQENRENHKGGASFRWSFGPVSGWGSIESMTVLTTQKSFTPVIIRVIFSQKWQTWVQN